MYLLRTQTTKNNTSNDSINMSFHVYSEVPPWVVESLEPNHYLDNAYA